MAGQHFSMQELELIYHTAAQIVKLYGDTYLPTFKRVHDEIEARRKELDIKSIALRVADSE